VVVVDTGGHILARPKHDQGDYSTGQLDFQRQIETELRRKILATLEPYVGFDRSRASVAAECDWNGGEQTEEIYDPNTVIMTTQRSEELSRPLQESGLPGTASNLPRQPATPRQGAAEHSRTMETTNYKTSRTVTSMRLERGNIKRLSVAVLVDQVVSWDDAAKKLVRTPRTVDEMESLRKLVVAAAGIDEKRGDVLIIDNLPFTIFEQPAGPPEEPETDPGVFWMDWLRKNRYNFLAAFVVLVIGLVVAMVWGRGHKKRKALKAKRDSEAHSERMQQQLEDAEEARQLKEAEEAKLLEGLRTTTMGTSKSQILKKHLEETATKDPAGFVDLLRSWIHEDDE
jgi:flagellar M-ring protein FliF